MKVEINLQVLEGSNIWVKRDLELPFAPFKGLLIQFAETAEDSNVLSTFQVGYIDWVVPLQMFVCSVDFVTQEGLYGIAQQIEIELIGLGWSSTRDKTRN